MDSNSTNDIDNKHSLTINIPSGSLGEFIASLLGQKRTITRRFTHRRFIANQDWILNIINTLNQRMDQNKHSSISFEATFYFKTGRTHAVSSYAAFQTFCDISNEETVGIYFKLSYLLYFPSAQMPEKQDINIQIFSDSRFLYEAYPTNEAYDEPRALVEYTINFTNLTFGEDISRHLATYIESILQPDDLITKLFKLTVIREYVYLALIITMNVLVYTLIFSRNISSDELKAKHITFGDEYKRISGEDPFTKIENKIDYIFNFFLLQADSYGHPSFFLKAMFVSLGAVGFLSSIYFFKRQILNFTTRSFVVINSYTNELSRRHVRKRNNIKWVVYVGIVVGIIAGLIATRIDKLLFT